MTTKALTLTEDIARLLRMELGDSAKIACPDGKITAVLSSTACEKNYGLIVQQIHRIIEECCPDRHENLFIHVQDRADAFHHVLKIWKSV
jgi:hypothetical protein